MKFRQVFSTVGILLVAGIFSSVVASPGGVSLDDVLDRVDRATMRSLSALEKFLTKIPESARPSVEQAMAALTRGRDEALAHLSQIPSTPALPEPPSVPTPVAGEPSSEDRGSEAGEGLARAVMAIEDGTTRALDALNAIRESVPEQALKGLNKAIESINSGRDRALAALDAASMRGLIQRPDLPEAAGLRFERPIIPERPPLPERPERPERPDRP